jgi:hypothetical protein
MVSDPNATALDPSVAAEVMEGVLQSLKADINLALGARYFTRESSPYSSAERY